jgi:hypothetical protein
MTHGVSWKNGSVLADFKAMAAVAAMVAILGPKFFKYIGSFLGKRKALWLAERREGHLAA